MTPDPADVLVARASDRLALIWQRNDAEAALQLCKELHEHSKDVRIALRCDNNPPEARRSMPAKFPGRCATCAGGIRVGEPIYFDAESRKAVHERCGR